MGWAPNINKKQLKRPVGSGGEGGCGRAWTMARSQETQLKRAWELGLDFICRGWRSYQVVAAAGCPNRWCQTEISVEVVVECACGDGEEDSAKTYKPSLAGPWRRVAPVTWSLTEKKSGWNSKYTLLSTQNLFTERRFLERLGVCKRWQWENWRWGVEREEEP